MSDKIQLLTRTGLDWSHRYKRTIEALRSLKVKSAYLDGDFCALNADGVPVFGRLQAAINEGRTDQLVFFAFDLLPSSVHPTTTNSSRLGASSGWALHLGGSDE